MARSKPCPLCGNTPAAVYAPFCSQGCRDRDLMQWLGEGYAIPVSTPPATVLRRPCLTGRRGLCAPVAAAAMSIWR